MTEPQPPLPPEQSPSPEATVRLRLGEPQDPHSTVKLDLPSVETDPGLTPKPPLPPESAASRGLGWKITGTVGALVVVGLGAYLFFFRGRSAPAPVPAPSAPAAENLPPGVQSYLDQAKAGDAHAMRMLGVMYYYGLNVPQDREKGLYWYRQAAEKGSDAAREELSKLQAGEGK